MGISTYGYRNGGSGDIGGGEIFTPSLEHHIPVYIESSNTGAMYCGGTAAVIVGIMTVLRSGRYIHMPRRG